MKISIAFAAIVLGSTLALGCMAHEAPASPICTTASPAPPSHADAPRHVYRLDFVLTGAGEPPGTSFTLNLQEADHGEVVVGKNVPLATGPGINAAPRQDVGIKVVASFRTVHDDDVLIEATLEMSSAESQSQGPSTIHKVVAKGDALATAGKSTLVASVDDGHQRYQLSVTPTKLR